MAKLRIGIIGGDKRQIELAKSIKEDDNEVYITGFENFEEEIAIENSDLEETINSSDFLVLPIPISRDKRSLNMPFSSTIIKINENLAQQLENKKIFCYDSKALTNICEAFKEFKLYDFSNREDFLQKNALLTAEGAVDIAIQNYDGSIYGSRCLVCGFGRIGKALAPILRKMGATVSVSARKIDDMLMIKTLDCRAILTSEIYKTQGYDLIFNTIPSLVLNKEVLESSAKGALIIDLASLPGGVDKVAAKALGIKVIHALGVPGKVSPKASGEVIKNTIYNMIQEANL